MLAMQEEAPEDLAGDVVHDVLEEVSEGLGLSMSTKLILLLIREGYGEEGISASTDTLELPMDSLEFMEFLQLIRRELGWISDKAAQKARTVGELAEAIEVPA